MKIDAAFIEQVAKNARLSLTDEEKKSFQKDFREILEAFSQLDEIDVDKEKLSAQPVELRNALREDTETACLDQKEALRNAQHKKDGYFKGPKSV